jgi:hypothetical protein
MLRRTAEAPPFQGPSAFIVPNRRESLETGGHYPQTTRVAGKPPGKHLQRGNEVAMAPQTCHVSVLARCFKPEGPETRPTARFPDSGPVFTGRQFGPAFRHQLPP